MCYTQRELCAYRCTYTHCCDHDECAAHMQCRVHTSSHVMEGICTAGALEEGEVVWQVRTRTRIPHTQTRRSTAALHMYLPHRESPVNVYRKSWSPQSSIYRSAVGTFRCMVCVQTFRRSTRRWYAVRFGEGEEHADDEKEEPRTSEEAHSRHPQHAAEMSCDRSQREKVCSSRTEGRSRRRTQTRQTTRAGPNSRGVKVPAQRRGARCIRRGVEIEGVRCALRG